MLVYVPLHNATKITRKRMIKTALGHLVLDWKRVRSVNATREEVMQFNAKAPPRGRIKYIVRRKI